ncbi:MAG: hypothetical protein M0Z67_04275 [Nitrospiraceae bacterium]|nr:hypothetical protein [Nitrospiraceae bacterium]
MKSRRIHLRCDDETLKVIEEKAAEAGGLTVSAYLRACGMRHRITPPILSAEERREIAASVAGFGRNLNQLSHAGNIGRVDRAAVEQLRKEASDLVRRLTALMERGRN